jgi:zinc transport system permease protein
MFDLLTELFSYSFVVRAFMVGTLVSLCAALLGVSLVLKRYSMIGDGLSHVGFATLALSAGLNSLALKSAAAFTVDPLYIAMPLLFLAAFCLLRLNGNSKIKGDAAIALISSSSLAVGVIIISLTTGVNTDLYNYLFGTILAINKEDLYLSIAVAIIVLILYLIFYRQIFAVTFDEDFAQASGINTGRYNLLIAFLTALVIVIGMRMMGAMLISSLIIFPALTSMRLCKSFKTVVISSAIIALSSFFLGIILSFTASTPAGASIVVINLTLFLLFYLAGKLKSWG